MKIFELDEEVGGNPCDYAFPHYALPNTFGKQEMEEAAARLIAHCQREGKWGGLSVADMAKTMKEEHISYMEVMNGRQEERRVQEEIEKSIQKYNLMSIATFGIWMLMYKKPELVPVKSHPDLPFSSIYMFGPMKVFTGIGMLQEREYVTVKVIDEKEIIFPTSKLLEPLTAFRR